jgi:2-phosphoglycerate kinase
MTDPDWTVLLIGGASATGKSTLAESLAHRFNASYIDADLFWIVLNAVVSAEVEPVLHLFESDSVWELPVDELVSRYFAVSKYICRAIEPLIAHHDIIGRRAVIEGCWLLPVLATQGVYANRHVAGVRALFLHEPKANEVEERIMGRTSGWLRSMTPTARRNHIEMQQRFGDAVKRQAEALSFPVLESQPFDTLIERALTALASYN